MRNPWSGIVGLLALAALVGCSSKPPSAGTQAAEVARLEAHVVPIVDELDVRFYLDETWSTHAITYPPGEFREGDDSRGSPAASDRPFDASVRTDFDRVSAAIEASAVDTYRFEASFTPEGALSTASFRRDDSSLEWNWFYLYDPNDTVAKDPGPGARSLTQINADWWLVTEVDD